jgi:hypothetical protein
LTVSRIAGLPGLVGLVLAALTLSVRTADLATDASLDYGRGARTSANHTDPDHPCDAGIWLTGGFKARRLARSDAEIEPARHDRVRSADPSPNDDPDVTVHIQALVLSRAIGPRAPNAHLVRIDRADATATRPDASGPFAPRPPPAVASL